MDDIKDLAILLKSRIPIIVVESSQETKVVSMLERIANLSERPLYVWNVTSGVRRHLSTASSVYNTSELTGALRHVEASSSAGIYLFLDAHPFLSDPVAIRSAKNIALKHDQSGKTLVFLSRALDVPDELMTLAAKFTLRLPTRQRVQQIVDEEIRRWEMQQGSTVRREQNALELLVSHSSGLSEEDVVRLARLAIRDDGSLTLSDIPRVVKAKHEFVEASEVVNLEASIENLDAVGGLQNLKRWLAIRREVFLSPPSDPPLPPPKGILLLGVQGAGKSLAAKAVAGSWKVPLLRLDFATLYNKYHGETERNLRQALSAAESMAPCVLWIDEIEKGVSSDAGGTSDGGVSFRVLGTLLTWMSERKSSVFLVATANNIEVLPPELLRKGRFDEIFFVDLPDAETRAEIFRIHLASRKLPVAAFDLPRLAAASEGFSGAEIEQAVISALYEAHAMKKTVDPAMVLDELKRTRPLSSVMSEKITALRAWAINRTIPA